MDFRTGRRNRAALYWLLRSEGLQLQRADLGGHSARTLRLELGSGEVCVTRDGEEVLLWSS